MSATVEQAPLGASSDPARDREHVRAVVARAGSSFTWGMRVLPKPRREAMYAIYAFCREVDDIADEGGTREQKQAGLAEWRREIDRLYAGQPTFVTARALREPVAAYDLPKEEFLALIDGMEMDATGPIVAPSREELALYCRRVAGAVGMLSINAFGAKEPAARELAVALGEGLQLTNILRDLDEDGAEGRLYLPREDLAAAGIEARDPAAALSDPALAAVCEGLAARAEARFAESLELLERCHKRALKPCVLMMEMYRRTLRRLRARGWAAPRQPVSLPAWEKLWILLRYGIF